MIPIEVENRIAKYFFHRYLPDDIMRKIEDTLLFACVGIEEEDLDHDELVHWAVEILTKELEKKCKITSE